MLAHNPRDVTPILEVRGLARGYGATRVVEDIDLKLFTKEAVAFVGSNGSGKTTLMKLFSGVIQPDAGGMWLEGAAVRFRHPRDALKHGIAMLSQFPDLYPDLNVVENIFTGQEIVVRKILIGVLDWAAMRTVSASVLSSMSQSQLDLDQPAGTLSGGQRKSVALARLLVRDPRIAIFDEPTASLGVAQRENVLGVVRRLKAEGKAVVLVTHDVREIEAVADRVVVMDRGRIVDDLPANGTNLAAISARLARG